MVRIASGGVIEVDPHVLGQVAARLTEAVGVAREVEDRRDVLKSYSADAGDEALRSAVESFLDAWGYGCGCLVEDAEQLAERLGHTSRLYLEMESGIAEGFGDG